MFLIYEKTFQLICEWTFSYKEQMIQRLSATLANKLFHC